MGYKNKEDDNFENFAQYRKPQERRLSEIQLKELDNELQKYKVEKEVLKEVNLKREPNNMMKISVIDFQKWLQDKKAINKDGAIKIYDFKPAKYRPNGQLEKPCDCKPILWEQLQEDLRQWDYWKCQHEFRENRKIEGFQELYEQIHIPREKSDDWERKQKFLGKDIVQHAVDNF